MDRQRRAELIRILKKHLVGNDMSILIELLEIEIHAAHELMEAAVHDKEIWTAQGRTQELRELIRVLGA